MKHFAEYAIARGLSFLMRLFPRRTRLACGRALGSLVFTLDARHRGITYDNLDRAFGEEKSADEKMGIARGVFRHFGAMLFELTTLGTPSWEALEPLIDFEGVENFERARAEGRGVILVAAHLGNWEFHAITHGFRFGKIHLVARAQDNPHYNRWLERVRRLSGNEVVYKQGALGQTRRLMKRGETVAFVVDQNVPREEGVFVDFFGRKAAATPAAAWFALKTGARLVPVFCCPTPDGRYRAVYETIDHRPFLELDRDLALQQLTQELTTVIERHVRERPECWLWMHRRWKTRPPGEAGEPGERDQLRTETGGPRVEGVGLQTEEA